MNTPRPETELSRRLRYQWVGRIGSLLLRALGRTWRVEWEKSDSIRALERDGHHVVYAFWHAHILPLAYTYRRLGVVVLVSRHGDGESITQVIHRLGFGTVRGSSHRGGTRSLLEMARHGRGGHPLAVTPDGPRGPRHRLQPGLLFISQRSGRPIVPLASAARPCRYLRSWDRFEVPYPFSRVRVAVADPIPIPPDLPPESVLAEYEPRVERAMWEVEQKARRWAGLPEEPPPEARPEARSEARPADRADDPWPAEREG